VGVQQPEADPSCSSFNTDSKVRKLDYSEAVITAVTTAKTSLSDGSAGRAPAAALRRTQLCLRLAAAVIANMNSNVSFVVLGCCSSAVQPVQ